ncbi:MAG: hypothetical protein NC901_02885 [Candidatus Omnitrophica bacterium]|nr:hypothetical protein [Candidatus Omnitrophota bacterium]
MIRVNNGKLMFKIKFNQQPTNQVYITAWDNNNCNSLNKIYFTYTKPLIIAYNSLNPPENLLELEPVNGGAENNRLKGNYSYKLLEINNLETYFGLALEIPKTLISLDDYFALKIVKDSNVRCILYANIGNDDYPSWVPIAPNNMKFYFSSTGYNNKIIIFPFANKLAEEIFLEK